MMILVLIQWRIQANAGDVRRTAGFSVDFES